MNPPNTAQTVKTRLLDKVLSSESLWSLSVTLGILNLKILQNSDCPMPIVRARLSVYHTLSG